MVNTFIFHGTAGHPKENWFPWMKKELDALGCSTIVPQFPTPKNQTLENWFAVFDEYAAEFTPETILIGHSLGGTFLLRVLERSAFKSKASFFVAASIGIRPLKNYETDKPFVQKPFDWNKIRSNAGHAFVFHSNNDPFVGIENSRKIASKLGVEMIFVENAGHFNAAAGYTRFEALLELVKKEIEGK